MKLIPNITKPTFIYLLTIEVIVAVLLIFVKISNNFENKESVEKRAEKVADSFVIAVRKWNNQFLTENDYSALWNEIHNFAGQYIKSSMSNLEFNILLAAIDKYDEPSSTPNYGETMRKLVSEQSYFAFPDRVKTFELLLWQALTRGAPSRKETKRRDNQHEWLREYIKAIPIRQDDGTFRGIEPARVYAWADDFLSKEFYNPLSFLYEAMTDEQFELFKALMRRSSSNGLRLALGDIRSRAIGARAHKKAQIDDAYRYPFDIKLPFDDEVTSSYGGTHAYLEFASNAQFRGSGESGLPDGGILDVINHSRMITEAESIRYIKANDDQKEDIITQWVQEHNTGDLAYFDNRAILLCLRGTKLAKLEVADWFEADSLSNEQLYEQIDREGIKEMSVEKLPPMNGIGNRLDLRIFIVVETAEKRLAVIEFRNREFYSVSFRCRTRPV
jgi:hypothetical protein